MFSLLFLIISSVILFISFFVSLFLFVCFVFRETLERKRLEGKLTKEEWKIM